MLTQKQGEFFGWVFLAFVVSMVLICGATYGWYRVKGDLAVCREFYPNMDIKECFFSRKTQAFPVRK